MMKMSDYPDLDNLIRVNIFSRPKARNSNTTMPQYCDHLGYLVKNGTRDNGTEIIQRWKCQICEKRFDSLGSMWSLLSYEERIKKVLYDLFIKKIPLGSTAETWGIPQPKLSQFKKSVVWQINQRYPSLLQDYKKEGNSSIMFADETYMGKRGSSNAEVMVIDGDFNVLATGPVVPKHLGQSISDTFAKIPQKDMKKLRVLTTDGESSYLSIAKQAGAKVIHLQQLHGKPNLGKVIINKFKKLGPHHLRYVIYTHWKVFAKGTHVLRFRWEIKLVKGKTQTGRGRPTKAAQDKLRRLKWHQEYILFQSPKYKKKGTAEVFINCQSSKLSLQKGAKAWMLPMFNPLFKIFKGKHMTSNRIESKNSQVKGKGSRRKQQDGDYQHNLFVVCAYIADHGHFPQIDLSGRPLYKYLMKPEHPRELAYKARALGMKTVQKVMDTFI